MAVCWAAMTADVRVVKWVVLKVLQLADKKVVLKVQRDEMKAVMMVCRRDC